MVMVLDILENIIDFINIILEIGTIILCFTFIWSWNMYYLLYIVPSLILIIILGDIRTSIIKKVIDLL